MCARSADCQAYEITPVSESGKALAGVHGEYGWRAECRRGLNVDEFDMETRLREDGSNIVQRDYNSSATASPASAPERKGL